MIVACPGGMTVHAEVAPDAAIKLNVANMALASPGDKLEIRGWYYKGREGRAIGTEFDVQLSNPLTGPKHRGAHPAKLTDKSADASK